MKQINLKDCVQVTLEYTVLNKILKNYSIRTVIKKEMKFF